MELMHWQPLRKIDTLRTQIEHLFANSSQDDHNTDHNTNQNTGHTVVLPRELHPLRYYFYEFDGTHHPVVYDFGRDRVAAFSLHRQLERQGKKLSAVQLKKLEGVH